MPKSTFASLLVLVGLAAGTVSPLYAGAITVVTGNPLITVFENGNGTAQFPGNGPLLFPGVLTADPGPGGLASALTFSLQGPPSLVAGDLMLQEVVGTAVISDVIRFNPAGTGTASIGTSAIYPASLVFYSDQDDAPLALADTGLPTGSYTNVVTVAETDLGGGWSGFVYTPTANQPGFVSGFAVTYEIVSDVPEPATASLLVIGGGLLLCARRRLKA